MQSPERDLLQLLPNSSRPKSEREQDCGCQTVKKAVSPVLEGCIYARLNVRLKGRLEIETRLKKISKYLDVKHPKSGHIFRLQRRKKKI